MGKGFQSIKVSAWRQTDVENNVIFGFQAILWEEELRDCLSDMSVANVYRLWMAVNDDRR